MRLRTRLLTSAAVVGALVAPLVPGAPAAAATPVIDEAIAWLETQQEADGGFEVANSAGFETPDAIYAIAAAAQTTTTWSTTEAINAVNGTTNGGKTPLDNIDDWVDSVQGGTDVPAKAQQAAKVIVLVAIPLGLTDDLADFDPSGDSAQPVDLLGALTAAAGTGDYSSLPLGGQAFAAWALGALDETVPPALLADITAAQQPGGGFDYDGNPNGTLFDADVTALVILGLVQGGVSQQAPVIDKAVVGLGLRQSRNGEWSGAFDDGSPNTTGLVMQAAAALGADPDSACWRNSGDIRFSGVPYPSPTKAMAARQADAGYIVGPYDSYGLNTTGTTQAVQGLAASEGRSRYEGVSCSPNEATGNRRTVHALYHDLLVRLAEPGGADYWTTQFDNGMSPALLAKRFTGTPEYAGRVVESVYRTYLGRPATAQERQAAAGLVTAGRRVDVIASLLGSDEYYDSLGNPATDEDWAEAVYLDALGRPASGTDVDYVLDRLDAGASETAIARSLLRSAEGRGNLVKGIYQQLLRRNPSAQDKTYWGGRLAAGVSPERVTTLFVGEAEYRNKTLAVV